MMSAILIGKTLTSDQIYQDHIYCGQNFDSKILHQLCKIPKYKYVPTTLQDHISQKSVTFINNYIF